MVRSATRRSISFEFCFCSSMRSVCFVEKSLREWRNSEPRRECRAHLTYQRLHCSSLKNSAAIDSREIAGAREPWRLHEIVCKLRRRARLKQFYIAVHLLRLIFRCGSVNNWSVKETVATRAKRPSRNQKGLFVADFVAARVAISCRGGRPRPESRPGNRHRNRDRGSSTMRRWRLPASPARPCPRSASAHTRPRGRVPSASAREAASLLRGVDEGKDHRLALVAIHGLRG